MSNDVQELAQVFDTLMEKVPQLFHALRATLFSPESGTEFGEAVGNFYQSLVNKGIPQEKALELTSKYLENFGNISKLFNMNSTSHSESSK